MQKNKLSLSVQYADPKLKQSLPRAQIRRWIQAALSVSAELTVRFVDAEEGQMLNRDYRGKDYATNVLTFNYTEPGHNTPTQADIVICTDVLEQEAAAQNKLLLNHAAHLIVHGVLHAQGYDHEEESAAEEMETLETDILTQLGLANPYADRH